MPRMFNRFKGKGSEKLASRSRSESPKSDYSSGSSDFSGESEACENFVSDITSASELINRLLAMARQLDSVAHIPDGAVVLMNFTKTDDGISFYRGNKLKAHLHPAGKNKVARDFFKLALFISAVTSNNINNPTDIVTINLLKRALDYVVQSKPQQIESVEQELRKQTLYLHIYNTMRSLYTERYDQATSDLSVRNTEINQLRKNGPLDDTGLIDEFNGMVSLQKMLKIIPLKKGGNVGLSNEYIAYLNKVIETDVIPDDEKEAYIAEYLSDVMENWISPEKRNFNPVDDDHQDYKNKKSNAVDKIPVAIEQLRFYRDFAFKGKITIERAKELVNTLCDDFRKKTSAIGLKKIEDNREHYITILEQQEHCERLQKESQHEVATDTEIEFNKPKQSAITTQGVFKRVFSSSKLQTADNNLLSKDTAVTRYRAASI